MASIKPIEGSSVHRIQSGQVIVDLCSVVKELVENSLDAGATSIDIRFKNHGIDAIEVQDNGSGISKDDYESIALKHYTSKLSSYNDLDTLNTFGFRGEALSSLCALSNVYITTAREEEAPKGSRLDFETSGKLKGISVIAAQRGTTVFVETIFKNIPVRRQELERNIKREYGKVLNLLQAYACISTDVRLSVSNTMGKKKINAFSTKGNKTTRENIANVYSAKALASLVPLDLDFEMQTAPSLNRSKNDHKVKILGHVSRPVVGEGRPLPDRQMFFVNSRPCTLPQVSKVFNEVYKSYNLSQSPFVFANLILDTSSYDVNVSPDKRIILLHDQASLLEAMKVDLTRLFGEQQQSVPQSQRPDMKLPSYKPLTISRQTTRGEDEDESRAPSAGGTATKSGGPDNPALASHGQVTLMSKFAEKNTRDRLPERDHETPIVRTDLLHDQRSNGRDGADEDERPQDRQSPELFVTDKATAGNTVGDEDTEKHPESRRGTGSPSGQVQDFNARGPETSDHPAHSELEERIPSVTATPAKAKPGVVPNAFDRMRPLRNPTQTATITIGDKTTTTTIGSGPSWPRRTSSKPTRKIKKGILSTQIADSLRSFAAPGSDLSRRDDEDEDDRSDSDPSDRTAPEPAHTEMQRAERSASEDEGSKVEGLEGGERPHSSEEEAQAGEEGSDDEYLDEEAKKKREEARVAKLIRKAEERAARPSQSSVQRVQKLLKGAHKDSTTRLIQTIDTTVAAIERQFTSLNSSLASISDQLAYSQEPAADETASPEDRLSLTVAKSDFRRMRIVGQFNLGFIIALRPSTTTNAEEDLFIIDQHASDEKSSFERLQLTTTLQNQRLVHPQILDLTAIDEEIIADNEHALLANGFIVSIDTEGDVPVGKRCTLLALPTSREVTFDTRDLEELLALLAETPSTATTQGSNIPRPSKVRRLLAMRACRSSVMIGRTLTPAHMGKLVRRMGEIDKPWNCPHGRPTMRHLLGLGRWSGWQEGSGVAGLQNEEEGIRNQERTEVDWGLWLGDGDEDSDVVDVHVAVNGGESLKDEEAQGLEDDEPDIEDEADGTGHSEAGGEIEEEGDTVRESRGLGLGHLAYTNQG